MAVCRRDVLPDYRGARGYAGQAAHDQRPFVGTVDVGVVHGDGGFDDYVDVLFLVVPGRDDDVGPFQFLRLLIADCSGDHASVHHVVKVGKGVGVGRLEDLGVPQSQVARQESWHEARGAVLVGGAGEVAEGPLNPLDADGEAVEPSVGFLLGGYQLSDRFRQLVNPFCKLIEPPRQLVNPFRQLVNPFCKLIEPPRQLVNPFRQLINPFCKLIEPPRQLVNPFRQLVNPFCKLIEPPRQLVNRFR